MVWRGKRVWLTFALCASMSMAFAQATFTTTGDWDNSANWTAGNIGDDISEDVTINATRVANLRNGFNYTIGNLNMNAFSGLTINSTGSLDVGESGTPGNLNATSNVSITVVGSLIIWGDLNVTDNLSLNITGTLIVRGNLTMDDAASVSVSGDLIVEGNFVAGDNTNFTIASGGSVAVSGTVSVGIDSNLTGDPGSFFAGGGCMEGTGSNWCFGGTLPIKLLYFVASLEGNVVSLDWATERQENFDHFEIEKASEDLVFSTIASIPATLHTTANIQYYSYIDLSLYTGPNYYRLKAIDLDGSVEYFNIEFVDYRGEQKIDVFPNPVTTGIIKLNVPFNPTPQDQVSLLDIQGKTVLVSSVQSSGVHEFTLPENAKAGLYVLRYSSPAFQHCVKVVVIR